MPRCWNDHDRTVAIQIVRLVETTPSGQLTSPATTKEEYGALPGTIASSAEVRGS